MGLIKAATTSISSVIGDQFKEYVTCSDMSGGVLIQRGIVNHGKANKNPTEGVITNGSTILVPEGCAMMLIENGKIVEFSAEAGTYTYDNSSEPSIFTGGFGKGLIDSIKKIGSRITYGGAAAKDQRVYYVNLLALTGNKFGSPQSKKITDDKYGMLEVTFFGEYAIKVDDPALLVQAVIGANPKDTITFSDLLEDQFKAKFVEKLTQAITEVMRKDKVPFGDVGMHSTEISEAMNKLLDSDLVSKYGIKISDVAIMDINLTDESMKRVSKIDDATIFADSKLQSGLMANATAEALKNASSNENGSMMGFMGMNMANSVGANLMGAVNSNNNDKETSSTGKFCSNCGSPTNGGKFCSNCGAKLD